MAEGLAMLDRAESLDWIPDMIVATKPPHIFEETKPLIVTDKLMAELSAQNNPHEVLGVFKQRWQTHPSKQGVWLALEEIRDPGNLGTIIRTADAAAAEGIILIGDCCDPYSGECVRASTGSIFAMPLCKMPHSSFVDFLRAWPGDSIATRMDASEDFRRPIKAPALLALGSEARGLSPAISNACKRKVKIPMRPGVESLNVATAAALMLYQVQE